MRSKTILTMLVLIVLAGMSSTALSEEAKSGSQMQTNASDMKISGLPGISLVEFAQPSPANIGVAINLTNNSTKEVWTSPDDIPTFVFAGITNEGNINMSIYTVSLDPVTNARNPPKFAGKAYRGNDGVIVYGKFVAIECECENATQKENCRGTIETANWFP